MSAEVEIRVYKTDSGVELTSFIPVEKPSMWQRIKNFFNDHDVTPYIKVKDLNNSSDDNRNQPKPAVEAGLKITF